MKNFILSLYAFHLRHTLIDAPDEVTADASQIWNKLVSLPFPLPGLKDLKSHLICYSNSVYDPTPELAQINEWLTKSQKPLPLGSFPTAENFKIESNLQAFRFNDTYAADLTFSLESPDINIEVHRIRLFNPNGCLLPTSIDASLGQTLWLYGEVDRSDEECKTLAKECAEALLKGTPFKLTPVNQGKLFGSLLFEYEAIHPKDPHNPPQQCHILVWMNNHQAPTLKSVDQYYDDLRDLLCCRHKIRYAYYQARLSYQDARQQYSQLERQGQSLNQLPNNPEERLKQLKRSLTEVSTQIFIYDCCLRDLQAHRTTIETNIINYEKCLKSFNNDFKGWQNFLEKDSQRFLQQIQTYLNYLNPGRDLFEKLTATIRGISEIEQVECDRQNLLELRQKAEREKEQERQIAEREKVKAEREKEQERQIAEREKVKAEREKEQERQIAEREKVKAEREKEQERQIAEREKVKAEREKEQERQIAEREKVKAEREKEQERQIAEREKVKAEREKNLENTIKVLGVGIATGTSTASAAATLLVDIKQYSLNLPSSPFLVSLLNPFLISLILSLFLGLLVGGFSSWLLKNILDKKNENG